MYVMQVLQTSDSDENDYIHDYEEVHTYTNTFDIYLHHYYHFSSIGNATDKKKKKIIYNGKF